MRIETIVAIVLIAALATAAFFLVRDHKADHLFSPSSAEAVDHGFAEPSPRLGKGLRSVNPDR